MKERIILSIVLFCIAFLTAVNMVTAGTENELFDKGVALFKQEKVREAVAVFSQLIAVKPDSPDAYRNRGVGYMKLNRYDDAISDFQKAIELKPDIKDLYSNMGVAWYYKKEYRKAIEFYDKELALRPDSHFGYFNRAICRAALKEYDRGLADVEKSLELYPDHYLALCLKGDLLSKTGRQEEAAGVYKKAMGLNSKHRYAGQRLVELQAEKAAELETVNPASNSYELQVGAYIEAKNARKMLKRLTNQGFSARILEQIDRKNRQWYMVRVGCYGTRKEALPEKAKLKSELGITAVLRPWGKF